MENWDALVNDLPENLDYMKRYIKGGCVHILPTVRAGEIRIGFDNSIAYGMCVTDSRKDDRERLADYFSRAAGEKISVAFETLDKNQQNTENGIYLDDLFKDSVEWDGNIETEDF